MALPTKAGNQALTGDWKECRDSHLWPDLVLIDRKPDMDSLELIRMGSHRKLGI